ncbi:MAG: TIGR02646 family protein [Bacteroides sp.]|nr:TIGR02646 family protein [Bacteroides sp.]
MSWDEFRLKNYDEYLQVRQQALNEQKNECAYTGLWLGEGTNQIVHIDHFYKKSLYPNLRFQWLNLFAAAKDLPYGSDYKDVCISGPLKHSDSQYKTFWSPLEANLEDKFWYRQDGAIEPHSSLSDNDKKIAQNTIEMYNLNADDLKRKRRNIIEYVRNLGQLEDNVIRDCMKENGFSFLVDFELRKKIKE